MELCFLLCCLKWSLGLVGYLRCDLIENILSRSANMVTARSSCIIDGIMLKKLCTRGSDCDEAEFLFSMLKALTHTHKHAQNGREEKLLSWSLQESSSMRAARSRLTGQGGEWLQIQFPATFNLRLSIFNFRFTIYKIFRFFRALLWLWFKLCTNSRWQQTHRKKYKYNNNKYIYR